ncbi:GNAT family N-acetyltransferase [Pedobacter cryoconitis]|uniref:Putative GNAT family N-acyltransferase n=1 Tax=Pedobacter cryoconitis TaxID=188932 RepID=A0A7X0MLS2_9SPHI|nr:GNAT family N-acetyltransferase [Pedobacter cryoconitis]MBB6502175.1 putative GNAT family N-acyltransferase [Pedobacter cryoconitis]
MDLLHITYILRSTPKDIDAIFDLYDQATEYQKKTGGGLYWQGFERSLIQKEMEENRHFKIMVDGQLACTFCIAHQDPLIWKEKDKDPAVYIHRIATNPALRGNSYVKHIVSWATAFARANQRSFVRMDTGSGNEKLNNYYISCGFNYLGVTQLEDTSGLPKHYEHGSFSLFEIPVN